MPQHVYPLAAGDVGAETDAREWRAPTASVLPCPNIFASRSKRS
jgi:hypothetical protein